MRKGLENGTLLPMASKRLRFVGTLERHAADQSSARARKRYPGFDRRFSVSDQFE